MACSLKREACSGVFGLQLIAYRLQPAFRKLKAPKEPKRYTRMNKFIKKIIAFSLKNKLFIFLATLLLIIWGALAFKNIPIEAFPDVTNTQITIITQWAGR